MKKNKKSKRQTTSTLTPEQHDAHDGGMMQKDEKIEEFLDFLIKNKTIDKSQIQSARVISTWIRYGRKKAEQVSKEIVQRLMDNGGTTDDGQSILFTTPSKEFDFIFTVLIAEGLIQKVGERRSKQREVA
jgi:hypothetical protein